MNTKCGDFIQDVCELVEYGLEESPIVACAIEKLANELTMQDAEFVEAVSHWLGLKPLRDAGPELLGNLLFTMREMQRFKAVGKLQTYKKKVCDKWHRHRSMEERKACPDYDKTEAYFDRLDIYLEADQQKPYRANPNDVNVSEGEHFWMQDPLVKEFI